MIDPTTAMAEIALVNDISGVCSSRETLRITSNPVNVANANTNSRAMLSGLAASVPAIGEASASNVKRSMAWFSTLILSVTFQS